MTSAPRLASAGEAHTTAPSSARGSIILGSRFQIRSPSPALTMFAAMAAPMVPVPSTATTRSSGTGGLADPHGFGVHELAHAQVGQFASIPTEFHFPERDLRIARRVSID